MTSEVDKERFNRLKITAKKYGGDDKYSWAIFRNGIPVMRGLSKGEVPYYKRQVANFAEKK